MIDDRYNRGWEKLKEIDGEAVSYICNKKKLSVALFFCDTTIPYHQTIVVAISAINDRLLRP